MARWDWLRWILTHPETTRSRRIEVALSKIKAGERKAMLFNRNQCTEPGLEKWRAQRTSTSIEVNTSRWRILFMSDQPEPTMVELFQYNHWANQELMAICMGLSDEMMVAKPQARTDRFGKHLRIF